MSLVGINLYRLYFVVWISKHTKHQKNKEYLLVNKKHFILASFFFLNTWMWLSFINKINKQEEDVQKMCTSAPYYIPMKPRILGAQV